MPAVAARRSRTCSPRSGPRRPIEQRADSGCVYFARHFRSADGSVPQLLAPAVQHYRTVSMATLPADNGYWSVVLFASSADRAVRRARDVATWTRIMSVFPLAAHWIDAEPVTGVDLMASIEDRVRTYEVDGTPLATGVVAVGDAAACTSPSIGRGASIALLHVAVLRDVLRRVNPVDHRGLVDAFAAAGAEQVAPLVADTLTVDRHRRDQIAAELAGRPYAPEDPGYRFMQGLMAGAARDPVLVRAASSIIGILERGVDLARQPDIAARVADAGAPTPSPGPDRGELLELLAGAAA